MHPVCSAQSPKSDYWAVANAGDGVVGGVARKKKTAGRCAKVRNVRSRVDFWLRDADGVEHWLEVKNCHLVYADGWGYFPDSVSERCKRHCRDLERLVVERGHRAT